MPLHTVYLSLGSNIQPLDNLPAALTQLRHHFQVLQIAPVYETPPVGFQDQAYFLNTAVCLQADLTPIEVKFILGNIETQLKRIRDPHNPSGPRTIDLDVVLWNEAQLEYGDKPWVIPDPDILRQIYIARPLADIAPNYVHPVTGQTLAQIAENLDTSGIQRRDDIRLDTGYGIP